MGKYYESLKEEIKQYFRILCPDYPEWIEEYIETPEMQRLSKISLNCGLDYTTCFQVQYWYSNLEHSVGVALIIWNFTHDKKQTLAGLFHDIATPAFKHCIDFMNGDAKTQEITEENTSEIIRNSQKIMTLLNRDGILVEEVENYKIYPLADNPIPKFSADRFEYTFASGLVFNRVWTLEKIKEIYRHVQIGINEEGLPEFTFTNQRVCEEYIQTISPLWHAWISVKDRTCMQFLADMCKSMKIAGYLTIEDLYQLGEKEIVERMGSCEDMYLRETFQKFAQASQVYCNLEKVPNKYCVKLEVKKRYVLPLVQTKEGVMRIHTISEIARQKFEELMQVTFEEYTYFDFDFQPYLSEQELILKKNGKM